MQMRSIASGAVALVLLTGAASAAENSRGGFLSGLWGGGRQERAEQPAAQAAPVQMAQASDPRISALEEKVRSLSGTIEELNFQILQMQEQMRKNQEDNEFRFQELEGGAARPANGGTDGKPQQKKSDAAPKAERDVAAVRQTAAPGGVETTAASAGAASAGVATAAVTDRAAGAAPAAGGVRPLGTITFDVSGNVTGGSVGDQTTVSRGAESDPDGTVVAALPPTNDPEELYRNAYEFILSGDYATAEAGFRDHIARFPKDARAADAQFWLGESLLGQEKYRDAAEVFLAANKAYPKSRKAPDMLLKLGVALAGLNQRDVACATFGEVEKRYPEMSGALKGRLKQERALASC